MTINTMSASLRGRWYEERPGGRVMDLACDQIEIPERRASRPTPRDIDAMYESIETKGLLQPISVMRKSAEQREADKNSPPYVLIFGATRLLAWQRKFNEAFETQDEEGLRRWHGIPAAVYESGMTDETREILELAENLERRELSEQEKLDMRARVLKLMKNEPAKKNKRGKKMNANKFSPPSQTKLAKKLGVTQSAISQAYKQYQAEAGIRVNWTKQTEDQYNRFIEWHEDKARQAAEDEAARKADAENAELARKEKEKDKQFKALLLSFNSFGDQYGELELAKMIEASSYANLLDTEKSL